MPKERVTSYLSPRIKDLLSILVLTTGEVESQLLSRLLTDKILEECSTVFKAINFANYSIKAGLVIDPELIDRLRSQISPTEDD